MTEVTLWHCSIKLSEDDLERLDLSASISWGPVHRHWVYALLELELTVLYMLKEHSTSWSTPQEIYCLLKARHRKILSVFTPMTALLKISKTVFIYRSYNSLPIESCFSKVLLKLQVSKTSCIHMEFIGILRRIKDWASKEYKNKWTMHFPVND